MKNKNVKNIFLIILGTSFLFACMHKVPNTNTNQSNTSTICFERDILPIFTSNCTQSSCHNNTNAADGYILINYNSITSKGIIKGDAENSKIYKVLIEKELEDRMPLSPNPALSTTQINLIKRWINEGAVNSQNCAIGDCDTNIFTYSGAVSLTLKQYCTGCHNINSASGGIVLDNFDGVKAVALNGKLLGSIKHLSGFSAMPQGGNKIDDCKIKQIEKWIGLNTPNN